MIGLICLIFVASCGKGTEVGNPNLPTNMPDEQGQTGDAQDDQQTPDDQPDAFMGNNLTYNSATHHIVCQYLSNWTATESAYADDPETALDSLSTLLVNFTTSSGPDKTGVKVYTHALHSTPRDLLAYLQLKLPSWKFTDFSNATLDGYMYDNPAVGSNGGNRKDYFFLQSNILLHVITESFGSVADESNISITLDSIQFYGE